MEVPQGLFEHITTKLIPINRLPASRHKLLLKNIIIETYPVGSCLFEQGDTDDNVYYLLTGKINMMATDQSSFIIDPNVEHALYPIGQMQPRQYSAHIINTAQILKFSKTLFDSLVESDKPEPHSTLEVEDTDSGFDWMTNLLKSGIFTNIPPQNMQRIFELFEEKKFHKGDRVIKQGDKGDYYYIIKNGKFEVTRLLQKQNKSFRLATLHEGESFGEESLLGNMPRNASVTAVTDGTVMCLDKESFLNLIIEPAIKGIDYDEAVQRVNEGAIWVDVRNSEKHQKNGFEGSRNFPLDTLRIQMNKLNTESSYIVYCDNGSRSLIAAYLLLKQGYSVCHLQGGIIRHQPQHARYGYSVREEDVVPEYTDHQGGTEKMLQDLLRTPDSEQSYGALKTVITSLVRQLEQALKEKVEAEVARNLAEQKLEAFRQGHIVNLVKGGAGNQSPTATLDTLNNR